jgi:hypothetical protein
MPGNVSPQDKGEPGAATDVMTRRTNAVKHIGPSVMALGFMTWISCQIMGK